MDAIESLVNATLGLLVSVLAVQWLFPVFGWHPTLSQSVAVTSMFWVLSAVRTYILRRVFRWLS